MQQCVCVTACVCVCLCSYACVSVCMKHVSACNAISRKVFSAPSIKSFQQQFVVLVVGWGCRIFYRIFSRLAAPTQRALLKVAPRAHAHTHTQQRLCLSSKCCVTLLLTWHNLFCTKKEGRGSSKRSRYSSNSRSRSRRGSSMRKQQINQSQMLPWLTNV